MHTGRGSLAGLLCICFINDVYTITTTVTLCPHALYSCRIDIIWKFGVCCCCYYCSAHSSLTNPRSRPHVGACCSERLRLMGGWRIPRGHHRLPVSHSGQQSPPSCIPSWP